MFDDFGLTEEQKAIQTLSRKFAQEHIRPIAAKIDDMPVSEKKGGKPVLVHGYLATSFPWDLVKAAYDVGLKTITLPEKYGGQYIDFCTQVVIMDELGYECASCCKTITQMWKHPQMVLDNATKDQCDRWLSPLKDKWDYFFAVAQTEPSGASDTLIPYDGPEGGIHMRVEKKKDGYVLNGTKTFIALGGVASVYLTAGRTDPTVSTTKGTSYFFVPKDAPGFSVISQQNKSGFRAYPNGELAYDNVFVPKEDLWGGKENTPLSAKGRSVGWNEIELSGGAMGMCRSAYEKAVEYAKTRVQGGKPIIQHQLIGGMLADMYMLLQAGRSLLWKTAWDFDHKRVNPLLSLTLARYTNHICQQLLPMALSVFGGSGVMKELPMEKYIRDALIYIHLSDGPSRTVAAHQLIMR